MMIYGVVQPVYRSVAVIAVTLLLHNIALAERHVVEIKNFKFTPSKLVVRPGDVVVWKNLDIVPHTATDVDGTWDTGNIAAGKTATLEFDVLSSSAYFCEYHPGMKAELQAFE